MLGIIITTRITNLKNSITILTNQSKDILIKGKENNN